MTNSEKMIVELTKQVGILEDRLDAARTAIARIDSECQKVFIITVEIDKRLLIIEDRYAEIRRIGDEKDRRRWMVTLAFIGSLLTLTVNVGLLFLKK